MMPFLFMGSSSGTRATRSDDNLIRTIKKDNSEIQKRKDNILLRNGHKRFTFSDGFTCVAMNQRNADRKHYNYLNPREYHPPLCY